MAKTAEKITLDELALSQGGKLSKGFNALNKLDNEQLLAIGETLSAGDYKPRANRYSAFAQLIGHSAPTTHSEARYIALRYFDAIGMPLYSFSTGSIWHSTPAKVARKFSSTTSLARYDANHENVFSGYKLVCVSHKQTTRRENCIKACLQGLVSNETGKTLYSVATKKQFALGNEVKTSKGKAKRNRKATKTTPMHSDEPTQAEIDKAIEGLHPLGENVAPTQTS